MANNPVPVVRPIAQVSLKLRKVMEERVGS